MQSWWMQIDNGHAALELRDVPTPVPNAGQVLVRVQAASLNRGEFITGHGLSKAGVAKAVGAECAGTVVQAPAGSALQAGDRVMGRCNGGFAEYALLDQREALPVPPRLDWAQAASVPLAFLVTYDMLVLQGRLSAGEWVLINGVTSGVGVASLQLAKALGARVIGTSGSAAKLERLKALGLDVPVASRGADFHDTVMAATAGKGVNLVVNTVGGSVFAENLRCAAFQARLATVGYVDGQLKAEIDIEALHAKRLTLFGVSNKLRNADQKAAAIPAFAADVLPMLQDGRITPLVDQVLPFDALPQAKAAMEGSQVVGKIVLLAPGA